MAYLTNPPFPPGQTQPKMDAPIPGPTFVPPGKPVLTNLARASPAFFDLINAKGAGYAS